MKNHMDNTGSADALCTQAHEKPAPRPDPAKEKLARALKANLLRRKQAFARASPNDA